MVLVPGVESCRGFVFVCGLLLMRLCPFHCYNFVVSDFFTPDGYDSALDLLQWAGHDVYCLQVVDPAELTCDWKGDVDLECVETGRRRQLTVGPQEAARFAEVIAEWNERLAKECARREIGFFRTTTEIPFQDVIQKILRRGGLVA